MLGDTCSNCNHPKSQCQCEEATPCLPDGCKECPEWTDLNCVFWMGDPIPGTPIKKGTRGTEIVMYLLSEINTLKGEVATLQGG